MGAASEIGRYLVDTVASLYLIIVVLRGILQATRADFYNPISQFIVRATHYPLQPFRKLIPSGKRFDPAVIILAILVQLAALVAVLLLAGFMPPDPVTLLLWSLLGVVGLVVNTILIALVAMIVVSWVAPGTRHPAVILLYQITDPIMTPFRSLLPNMGGLDFSPIMLFVLINIIQIMLRHMSVAVGLPTSLVIGI